MNSSMAALRSLRYVTMQRPALSVGSQINDKKHSKLLSSQSVPASGNVRRGDACRRLPCTDDPRVEWPLGTSGLSLWYTQLYVAAPREQCGNECTFSRCDNTVRSSSAGVIRP